MNNRQSNTGRSAKNKMQCCILEFALNVLSVFKNEMES